jgi:outer membrane autotransporter protein
MVTVNINNTAATSAIVTTGPSSNGILAQSAGGTGDASYVNVNNFNVITVSGTGTHAIFAVCGGKSGSGQITITNYNGATITGSPDGTAPILMSGGSNNSLINYGTITSAGALVDGGQTSFTNYGALNGQSFFGDLINHGTLNPGNSPGTMTITGSYTQSTVGTLITEVASVTSYDRLVANGTPGTATLTGALAPTPYGGFKPRGNQVFSGVVSAVNGITGSFNQIINQQISPTLFWQTRDNPTSVDLQVQRNYTNSGLTLNSNQQGVGAMLNRVAGVTNGDLDVALNAIDYLPDSARVRDAFKQISPEKAGALTNLGFAAANFQMRNLANRTTNLRFVQGASGANSSLSGGGLNCNYSRLNGLMLAYNGASLANLFSAKKEFRAPENRWGLYLDGGAAFGSQNSTINQTGYSYTLGGMTLGADYRLRDNLLVGLASGYSNTNAGFYGAGGSVTTNTVPVNAYAAWFPGNLYAYGSLGYALNLYNLTRNISFNGVNRRASSSTTGNQLNLYGETGYDFTLSSCILTPSATLAYSGLWVGGFTESGAGALNLKVAPQNANSVQTGIGARVTVPLQVGAAKVVPQGYVYFQHEFANGSRGLNAGLSQGGSTFSFQTDAAKRNFALVGASVTAKLSKNVYAQINFGAEVGRTGSNAQSINAGLRWEF